MNDEKLLKQFSAGEIFEKKQFREVVREAEPAYADSSVSWLLGKLKREKKIASVGRGKYMMVSENGIKSRYTYSHSREYDEIERQIVREYPLVDFQMWELIQFNEFVKHQIAKNLILVEVENMLEEAVFETLHRQSTYVLFSPRMDYYYRHRGEDNTVVVLKLVSEAPKPYEGHSSPLEKLLVDLFVNKFTGHLIEHSEYPAILEDAFHKYYLDETKMFRYARRRGAEEKMREFIHRETAICLMTDR